MISLKYSYGDINAVQDLLKKNKNILGECFVGIVSIIARNTSLFNAFVAEFKKGVGVDEETELTEDKLQNDIKSLKKIGWKLPKLIPFMITKGDEYGVKMTADLITMYYTDGDAKKAPKMPAVKVPKPKKVSWPKRPPASKVNDPQHAEAYLGQVIDSEEIEDMTGVEALQILTQAGYTEHAAMWVIRNLGWEGDVVNYQKRNSKFAKKTAPKFRK